MENLSWVSVGCLILCFNAGYINALTINTAYQISSAHVTGIIGKSSDSLYEKNYTYLYYNLSTYCFFLVGAMTSGFVIHHETFNLGWKYGKMLIIMSVCQTAGVILEYLFAGSLFFIWVCSLTCGMQNALTSKYSNNIIRTTHLTGTTTDMGITIAHVMKGRTDEAWKIGLQVISIMGFFTGGVLGSFAFHHWNHYALVLNILFNMTCGIIHIRRQMSCPNNVHAITDHNPGTTGESGSISITNGIGT